MFEGIVGIIKKIVIFSLIAYGICELTPKEEYRKYINLFAGMVLLLIVLGPIYTFFSKDNSLEMELKKFMVKGELDDMETYFNEYDKMRIEEVARVYNDEVVAGITDIVEKEQLYVNSVDVELNLDTESQEFLKVLSVDLTISRKYQDESIKVKEILLENETQGESIQVVNIKNKISQFYNVETDNINISK